MEKGDKPLQEKGVTRIKKDIDELKHTTEGEIQPRQNLRAMRQEVAYHMGDDCGLGIGSVI